MRERLITNAKKYAEDLYSDQLAAEKTAAGEDEDDDDEKMDLEASIKAEVEGIKRPSREPLFVPVKLDVQCGELNLNPLCMDAHSGA